MLSVAGLRKSYGTNQVLKGLSLNIDKGSFYSLLGPNGAGKSTTLNCIAQLLRADSGSISINGIDASKNSISTKAVIGVVPQEIALYEEMSAWENLRFWGQLNRVASNAIDSKGKFILEKFGLYDRRNEKIKTYSGGMKRRINIACALLHDPQLILMDEPTVGIDPQSRNNIYEFIEHLKHDGKTILYTTHYMEEAERFSDKIGILDNGIILSEGTLKEVRIKAAIATQLIAEFEGDLGSYEEKIKASKAEGQIKIENNRIIITTENVKEDLKNLVSLLGESHVDLQHIEKREADLETIFLQLTGKQLRD